MTRVLGIDSSTQSCKAVLVDADTGAVLDEGRAPHPDGTEVDPAAWWTAVLAATDGLWDDVEAVAVAGQQHGLVAVDSADRVVRPALLWNDTRSAGAAGDLVDELGGPAAWAEAVGSVPVASFTVTKLRWLADHEPASAGATSRVMLPHDWLTWRLGADAPVTDRGDASGTGYWSPAAGAYRPDLVEMALRKPVATPEVAAPDATVGHTAGGALIGAGTGDNMAAALGLGIGAGDVVVSIGTSGTAFAVSDTPTLDASGLVAGFADAAGRFLPLVCTLNGARVLTSVAGLLGATTDDFDDLALATPPGAGGLVLLPYLDGERTPNLPDATGSLHGLTRQLLTREHVARAAVEGLICGLADGVDALRAQGAALRRVVLIGGAAQSRAVRAVAAQVLGVPVVVPEPAEYVALGAARQAAWALSGSPQPPSWPRPPERVIEPSVDDVEAGRGIRERYRHHRDEVYADS
jgi:xylulokinase